MDESYKLDEKLCELIDESQALAIAISKIGADTEGQRETIVSLKKKSEAQKRKFWNQVFATYPGLKNKNINYNPNLGSIEVMVENKIVKPR